MRRLLLVSACVAALAAAPPARRAAQAQAATPPRLLVVLVVDQMRADYLTTFASRWQSGFRTLLSRSAHYVNAEYPYWNTITCAGHSTISTGTLPRTHGMVLNRWWDRAERRPITCTDDPAATAVPYQRPSRLGGSAKRQMVTTLADELRKQRPGARVVSLSLKPRSAIGLAGHGGDAVVWFDEVGRTFATSTAFTQTPEVKSFMERDRFEAEEKRDWALSAPPASYQYGDVGPLERPDAGWTSLFPHRLAGRAPGDVTFTDHWQRSPYSDAYLARLATTLVDEWKLGQRDTTDFLGVSFSALDMVGHDFGPRSREVEDILIRLDATIGELVAHLDRVVGRDRYVLALTADHGVATIPEQVGAGRIASEDLGAVAEQALVGHWGPSTTGPYVVATLSGHLYFADGVFDRLRGSAAAMHALERALLEVPGVERVLRRDQLDRDDAVTKALARGYVDSRSGDVFVIPKRDWVLYLRVDGDATNHGTSYEYDRRVPLMLIGPGLAPGKFTDSVGPLDIAPTLAKAAGLAFTNRDGRPLQK